MSVVIQKLVLAVTYTYSNNFGFGNFALYQLPVAPEGPDTQVGPARGPLMSVAIQKLFQAVFYTYVINFALVKMALNKAPWGPRWSRSS